MRYQPRSTTAAPQPGRGLGRPRCRGRCRRRRTAARAAVRSPGPAAGWPWAGRDVAHLEVGVERARHTSHCTRPSSGGCQCRPGTVYRSSRLMSDITIASRQHDTTGTDPVAASASGSDLEDAQAPYPGASASRQVAVDSAGWGGDRAPPGTAARNHRPALAQGSLPPQALPPGISA